MKETIDAYAALALCFEFFFFGGSVFTKNKKTESILRVLMCFSMIIAISIEW